MLLYSSSGWRDYVLDIQGVPKKIRISVSQAVVGLESGLEIEVGSVLKNSAFFLSDEHKNFPILSKNS